MVVLGYWLAAQKKVYFYSRKSYFLHNRFKCVVVFPRFVHLNAHVQLFFFGVWGGAYSINLIESPFVSPSRNIILGYKSRITAR